MRNEHNTKSEKAKERTRRLLQEDPDYFKRLARRNTTSKFKAGNRVGFGKSREWAVECGRKGGLGRRRLCNKNGGKDAEF